MGAFVSSRGWSLIVWLIVFNVLLITILALRFYAARLLKRSFRLDDGFIMVAYVGTTRSRQRWLSALGLTIARVPSLRWKAQPCGVSKKKIFRPKSFSQFHQLSPMGWVRMGTS